LKLKQIQQNKTVRRKVREKIADKNHTVLDPKLAECQLSDKMIFDDCFPGNFAGIKGPGVIFPL
jgi:hypothetical protein